MKIYEEITNSFGTTYIRLTDEDGKIYSIPMVDANSDYQAYLNKDKPKAALSTPIVNAD